MVVASSAGISIARSNLPDRGRLPVDVRQCPEQRCHPRHVSTHELLRHPIHDEIERAGFAHWLVMPEDGCSIVYRAAMFRTGVGLFASSRLSLAALGIFGSGDLITSGAHRGPLLPQRLVIAKGIVRIDPKRQPVLRQPSRVSISAWLKPYRFQMSNARTNGLHLLDFWHYAYPLHRAGIQNRCGEHQPS